MKLNLLKTEKYIKEFKVNICKPHYTNIPVQEAIKLSVASVFEKTVFRYGNNEIDKLPIILENDEKTSGCLMFSTKKGIKLFLKSMIERHSDEHTKTMYEAILKNFRYFDIKGVNVDNRLIVRGKKKYQFVPYLMLSQNNLRNIMTDSGIRYYPLYDDFHKIMYYRFKKFSHKNALLHKIEYIMLNNNDKRFIGRGRRPKFSSTISVYNGSTFYSTNKISDIDNELMCQLDKDGKAILLKRALDLTPKPYIYADYIVKYPPTSFIKKKFKNKNLSGISKIRKPYYSFHQPVMINISKNATIIEDPNDAYEILSRISKGIYVPDDKPMIIDPNYYNSSSYFLLGLPEM